MAQTQIPDSDQIFQNLTTLPPNQWGPLEIQAHKMAGSPLPTVQPAESTAPAPVQPMAAPQPPAHGLGPATASAQLAPSQAPQPLLSARQPGTPGLSPAQDKLNHYNESGSGLDQFAQNHKALSIPLRILEGLGTVFAPGLTASIPGTQLHHQVLTRNAQGAVNEEQNIANNEQRRQLEQTQNEEGQARIPYTQAETQHLNAETQNIGKITPKDQAEIDHLEAQTADIKGGGKPSYHVLPDGTVISLTHDTKNGQSKADVVYKGDPKVQTHVTQLEIGGKPHQVLVNTQTGETVKDLGETGEKPPTVNVNQGSWALEEDQSGKPVLFNAKTGETRAAPPGMQKPGTAAKATAAEEKLHGPGRDALEYADTYMKTGAFSGPGDEALMEKFFELAKPSTGFRMSQPQIDMLKNARSWMSSVKGRAYHAINGTWFPPDQRNEIVSTMRLLNQSKGSGQPATSGATQPAKPQKYNRETGEFE